MIDWYMCAETREVSKGVVVQAQVLSEKGHVEKEK